MNRAQRKLVSTKVSEASFEARQPETRLSRIKRCLTPALPVNRTCRLVETARQTTSRFLLLCPEQIGRAAAPHQLSCRGILARATHQHCLSRPLTERGPSRAQPSFLPWLRLHATPRTAQSSSRNEISALFKYERHSGASDTLAAPLPSGGLVWFSDTKPKWFKVVYTKYSLNHTKPH